MYREVHERRRAPPRREGSHEEVSIKIPLTFIKKGQRIVVDYAVPREADSDSASIEQHVGTLVAMDQHQNTLIDTEGGERLLLRGARVVKIRIPTD